MSKNLVDTMRQLLGRPTYKDLVTQIQGLERELAKNTAGIAPVLGVEGQYGSQLQLILDHVPDLIWAKDLEGRFIFSNKCYCEKLLKCDPAEVAGKKAVYFANREREAGHEYTFGEICANSDDVVKSTAKPGRFLEHGLVRGKHLIIDILKSPIFSANGKMIGTVGCGRDITNDKETSEMQEKASLILRNMLAHLQGIAVQGYDEQRRVFLWNVASERLYGYTREEALGKKLEDLIVPKAMRDEVIEMHRRAIVYGEEIPPGELILRNKQSKDVHVFSSHLFRKNLTGTEMFCIDLDIGPIRQIEAEKQAMAEKLEKMQRMETIGALSGGIAHDFNNILQVIMGNVEMILADLPADSPAMAHVLEVKNASEQASELVHQLLFFGRKAKTNRRPLQINKEIEQTASMVEKTIPEMVSIQMELDPALFKVMVDPIHIQQVILNLVANAVHAIEGQGSITIKTENFYLDSEEDQALKTLTVGSYVCLSVSDTGHGMEESVREKVFEPFFTTKDVGYGTGLGLSSVYGIVKQHEGEIICKSTPGKGTCFEMYLPALVVKDQKRA